MSSDQGAGDYAPEPDTSLDGRLLDEQGRPLGYPLAGPGEDGPEPPEGDRLAELDAAGRRIAERIPPPSDALQRRQPDDLFVPTTPADDHPTGTGYRAIIATDEYPNGRPVDPTSLHDLRAWGATIDFMLTVGQLSDGRLTDLDRRALDVHRSNAAPEPSPYNRAPLTPVDATDDAWGEVLYAALREDVGPTIPEWQHLSDRARDAYRRQGRFMRRHLAPAAGSAEPQRVVVGFGSPAVVAEVVETLRRWRDEAPTDGVEEIDALLRRIEGDEPT